MNEKRRIARIAEPYICCVLLILMIFEIPYFNLYLLASFGIAVCLVMLYGRRPLVNCQMLLLGLFIILYFAFDECLGQSQTFKVWYSISVISIYASGYYANFNDMSIQDISEKIEKMIRLIATSYFAYVLITVFLSVINGQLSVSRNPINIWTGVYRASTHYGTMLIIPVAYGISLLVAGIIRKEKVDGAIFCLGCAIMTIMFAGRTIMYFIPVGFVCAYFYNVKVSGEFTRKHANQLAVCIAFLILFAMAYYFNLFGIQTLLRNSNLGQRYVEGYAPSISEDGRMEHIIYFFTHIGESIWGGGYTRTHSGNIHNVFFNVFDLSGIIPFILLVVFSIRAAVRTGKVLKSDIIEDKTKVILFVILVLALLQMMIEPVMESVPVFTWCVLYILGMLDQLSIYT